MNPDPATGDSGNELPILAYEGEITEALASHSVILVCGSTGSGKTTQLPQFCLRAGFAEGGLIACTQPRRIAAVTVAERVAEELGAEKNLVGWQHRYAKKLSRDNRIKFMTDGVLLAELRSDPLLKHYRTIIVDEAHERTLNIDFILGCLKKILPRRPDLRVIISSATLDVKPFSEFFDNAPVIEVPGRTFPIDLRWRPMENEDDDLAGHVAETVGEALRTTSEGDLLVFLPGERDIRAAADALALRSFPHTLVLPLHASLSPQEQRRAFIRLPGTRRIILSTNVAETSLTIPGIRVVIDSGLARISRYSARAHIKRLPIEPVSRASADQRKGRCGRIGPGLCIRLFSAEDFSRRPEFTEPDIRRTSLAATILSMLDWKLGDIETFPFLQPPANTAIREGYKELLLLGAIRENDASAPRHYSLTQLGRRIARLPIDPALSRMLFEAASLAALKDALVVVSALSCEDPLVRPLEKSEVADREHETFRDKVSDFSSILKLWNYFHDPKNPLSRTALRRECKKKYVSFRKFCEWEDLHAQLQRALEREKCAVSSDGGGAVGLHRAILSGLLANIGQYDPEENNYKGTSGSRFRIFPGSTLARAKKKPAWIVCAERVETSLLFARRVSPIDPEWIEPLARSILRYSYTAEGWDPLAGVATARRRAVLLGLTVEEGVSCDISRVNPSLARDIFVREGLVSGAFPKPVPPLVQENLSVIRARLKAVEQDRSSSPESVIDDFCERWKNQIPADCVCVKNFRHWLSGRTDAEKQALLFSDRREAQTRLRTDDFPEFILLAGRRLRLSYKHAPGDEADGITCTLSPEEIPLLRLWDSSRLVPGALRGKVLYLLRRLPHSALSKLAAALGNNVRAIDTEIMADSLLARFPAEGSLCKTLCDTLTFSFGVPIPEKLWQENALPPPFRLRWRIVARSGNGKSHTETEIFTSRSRTEIFEFYTEYRKLAPDSNVLKHFCEQEKISPKDDFPVLPESVEAGALGSLTLRAFPALCAEGARSVSIRLFSSRAAADAAHREGCARFSLLSQHLLPSPDASQNEKDIIHRASLEIFTPENLPLPRSAREIVLRARPLVPRFYALARDLRTLAGCIETQHKAILASLDDFPQLCPETVQDIAEQIGWLTAPGYLAITPTTRLAEYPRYLEAVERRIERAGRLPREDLRLLKPVREAWSRYTALLTGRNENPPFREDRAERYRWLLEEFRVATWAQALGTPEPASLPRLNRLWTEIFS